MAGGKVANRLRNKEGMKQVRIITLATNILTILSDGDQERLNEWGSLLNKNN